MNTLYIHVGPHKTGTTIIQKFLLDNQAELFKQNLVYPKRFQSIFGHHPFRDMLAKKALSPEDIEFFNAEHDFLLSSEDFISLEREHWEYLLSSIENKHIVILFAWRRASLKLYSIWQETVKHGGVESFFAYYHDHIARPGQSQMLSADLKLNMLSHVFGKQKIRVLDYDACVRNQDLLPQFCHMAGLHWHQRYSLPFGNANARNESMNIVDTDIIRALNYRFKQDYGIEGSTARSLFTEHKAALQGVGLTELCSIVETHLRTLTVGNYFIDNRGEKIMQDKFAKNIVNYEPHADIKQIKVATESWLMSARAQQLITTIAQYLYEVANSTAQPG